MAVHKKTPADAEASGGKESETTEKPIETKTEEVKTQPVIISDVITETIEVISSPLPQSAPEEPTQPSVRTDPLNDFKEKVEQEMNMPEKSQKNFMWPILFIFIIAMVLLAGVFAYKQGVFKAVKVNVVSVSPTPTASPEPTKTLDLTKYEIEVLNGSSVDGLASSQKAVLEAAGFTVSSIGNADNSDYTDTVIQAKTEVDKDFIVKLKGTLSEIFTVGEIQSLSEDSSVPVVVILGTKK
jgi:hypothetical protein